MLNEDSTLASIAYVLAQTVADDYGIDPTSLFGESGIDSWKSFQPGERIPVAAMDDIWSAAVEATNDPLLGLVAGKNIEPSYYYAFGHSWLASETIVGALRRLCRYHHVISTEASHIDVQPDGDSYIAVETYPDPVRRPRREAIDFGIGAVLKLCQLSTGDDIHPLGYEVVCDDRSLRQSYAERLGAPVAFNQSRTSIRFRREDVEAPLTTSVPDVARATDKITEKYLASMDGSKTSAKVRQLLIDFLPSGKAHQERVAHSMHRSTSTLQRQLQSEGTSYRIVLEDTRRDLAKEYLRDRKYSHAQIAYLLGFADQSNFSRAFKRWTSVSPRQYQSLR